MRKLVKRICLIVWVICLGVGGLFGCSDARPNPRKDGILTVVSTSFAGYDFARQLTKDAPEGKVELILLGKPGQDMHSFEPTASDILTLSKADILLEVGNETWMNATLKSALNEQVVRVNMMTVSDTVQEVPTEGMDTSVVHDHDHGAIDGACALIGTDEHVWLSTTNARKIAHAIGHALDEVDASHGALWEKNLSAYEKELDQLTADYAAMRAGAVRDTVLIADRYPFAYLMRELNLTCHAAFPGCSSETDASTETKIFLIEKTRELSLPYIFIIEGGQNDKFAGEIAAEGGADVLTLDSIQVVTDSSKTYVGIMRENLEKLRKALY